MKTKKNSELKIGEIVVYPKHGVGEIAKIETMEISVKMYSKNIGEKKHFIEIKNVLF